MQIHELTDIELINQYTRKELSESDVYVFTLTLCDNEIDRDFEAFTKQSLEKLCVLFLGKTGIFDHNASASNQSARVFKTWVEESEILNSYGERYACLKAKAYMVRTDKNKTLIDEIEGGIKKEVSVSCAVEQTLCSVCGKDLKSSACEHIKGRTYGNTLCFGVLTQPKDAYEWSFVAVPAQRLAGVTKSFFKEDNVEDSLNILKAAQSELSLSLPQVQQLQAYVEKLEGFEKDAQCYRDSLIGEIEKYALIAMPAVSSKDFAAGCRDMSVKQLCSVRDGLKAQAEQIIPPTVQLTAINSKKKTDNEAYTI